MYDWARGVYRLNASKGYNRELKTTPSSREGLNFVKLDDLKSEIDIIAETSATNEELRSRLCEALNREVSKYNWVGFYMIDKQDPQYLLLQEYEGAMTVHIRIPLNQGICGAAASSGEIVNVPDVRKDPRYLCCSLETQSEIVVPVFGQDKTVLGELDIDSHMLAAFGDDDIDLLRYCAEVVGNFMERQRRQTAKA